MKRLFDTFAAATGLILLFPVLLILAAAIRIRIGPPVLFRQERPGRFGKPFNLVKFRTMTEKRGSDGALLPDAERITKLGHWLRESSLDELPELWNVVLGDMSLVGPRPLLMQYLPLYSTEQARRNEVRPGITGWAQVSGRNAIDWDEKLALDVWYIDNRSILLDLRILWRTVKTVVGREGISAAGEATMPPFLGTRRSQINP
jgi:lipopolysaccharide/colanic/teichoic acid biosynthesis glycosyltransferase